MATARRAVFLLATVLLIAPAAGATTGGVRGVVKDASGDPVAGAQVTLVLQNFGTEVKTKSNKKGKFIKLGMSVGTYDIWVSKEGYQTFQGTIHVQLKRKAQADVVLYPAGGGGGLTAIGGGGEEILLGGKKLSEESAEAYEAAQKALEAGDQEVAIAKLEAFLALEPDVASTYPVLAQLHRDRGNGEAAVKVLRQGLEIDGSQPDAWIALGEMQTDASDYDGALASFQRAVELQPKHVRANKKLAMAMVMKQDWSGAVPALETYLKLAPDASDAASKKVLLEECRKLAAK